MSGHPATDGIDAFTSVASTYEGWFATPMGRFVDQQELQVLVHIVPGMQPGTCIDIGAGTGHIAVWLDQLFGTIRPIAVCILLQ